ncbi:MAG: hypothetical protein ACON5M_01395, partial [Chitinophagales bacterium]
MKTLLRLFSIGFLGLSMTSNAQFVASCPGVNAGPDALQTCTDSCTTLNAQFLETAESTQYRVDAIPYNPFPYTIGTGVSVGTDDVYSPIINLPFPFCFYGNNYTQVVVGSNGIISFDTNLANAYCEWS